MSFNDEMVDELIEMCAKRCSKEIIRWVAEEAPIEILEGIVDARKSQR